jgi:hypothetical protein
LGTLGTFFDGPVQNTEQKRDKATVSLTAPRGRGGLNARTFLGTAQQSALSAI